jgi:hypothetical protein
MHKVPLSPCACEGEEKELLLQKIRLTMKFSPYVTDLLKQKSGKDFRLTSDCEYLALDIESVTGEHIGVNTLKRL